MDINKLIAELRLELKQVEQTIQTLEAMSVGSGKRRGRPPKWLVAARGESKPKPPKKRAAKKQPAPESPAG